MQRFWDSAIFASMFILAMAGQAVAAEPVAAAPVVSVGDSWTYQYTDGWKHLPGNVNRLEVTSVDAAGIGVDVKRAATGAVISHQRFSAEMNPVDRGKMHFAPWYARYAFPLAPGKEWTAEATGENAAAGKRWHYQFKGKALGWEKIKVPAGEFEAIKVEVTGYYQGEETGRRGGSGQSTEVVWFAPAVNNFVRLEYQDTDWKGSIFNRDMWELAAFSKK